MEWFDRFIAWLFGEEYEDPDQVQADIDHMQNKIINAKLDRIIDQLHAIMHGEALIMTAVQVEQEDIDAVAADLLSVGVALAAEIADLEAKVEAGTPLAVGDLSGLKAAQTSLDGLVVPAATPPADVP